MDYEKLLLPPNKTSFLLQVNDILRQHNYMPEEEEKKKKQQQQQQSDTF